MVNACVYDSKMWASSVVLAFAREPGVERHDARDDDAWRDLDRQLRRVAARRSALDHEELTLIRKAIRVQLWRRLGMASMREYLELAMGYGPRVASERLRVSEALEGLPALEDALATGELSYSAVRELTRIATCKTEEAWLEACRGKSLRQIEELVAEREPGDAPTDRPKPELRTTRKTIQLRPAARAIYRQVQHAMSNARGEPVDDSDLIEELGRMYLGGHREEETSRPRVQIAITRCDDCGQARQHAGGRMVAITEAEYEAAACDAVMIGSLDGTPTRASSTIPPKTRRQTKQRDSYKCTVPWCRSAWNLDVHHIVHREHGGGNEPENLTTLCWGHHSAHHRGELLIEGKAPALTFRRRAEMRAHVGEHGDRGRIPSADATNIRDAVLALTALGFKKHEARAAVAAASIEVSPDAGLEPLIRASLRELR